MLRLYTCYPCGFPFKAKEDDIPPVCPSCGAHSDNYLWEPYNEDEVRRLHVDPPQPDPNRDPLDTSYHHPKFFPAGTRHGRIRQFSLSYDDADVTRKFYEEAFGWDIIDREDSSRPDRLMFAATGPGTPNWEPSVPSFTFGYLKARGRDESGSDPRHVVEVDNIAETVKKAEEFGGRLLRDEFEEDGKLFAVIEDSEGNPFYLWQTPDSVTWDEPESQTVTQTRRYIMTNPEPTGIDPA